MADSNLAQRLSRLTSQISTIIVGKEPQITDCIACLLAGGHLLIEDLPGVGKTTLAHALAVSLGLKFSRVQFTADLMPSDLIGVSVFERSKEAFNFHPGPVFTQVLLADEINRAGPKTQSALLEAMEEQQVTVENETRPLPRPFFVIATQNPSDQLGTYPLPESQLDRFLMCITLGYPDRASERALLAGVDRRHLVASLGAVMTPGRAGAGPGRRAAGACRRGPARLPAGADRRHPLGPVVCRGPEPTRGHLHPARRPCPRPAGAARLCGARRHPGHPAADRRAPAGAGGQRRARPGGAGARHGRGRRHSVIRGRLRRWFENRLPRSDSWTLTQRNLYILPTKAGWGFCLTLLVMLLASVNYQLNLGYALTFLLGGAALAAMHQTHGNLRRLQLHVRPPAPVFAGEPATLEVVLDNPGSERHGVGLGLYGAQPAGLAFCDVPAQGSSADAAALHPAASAACTRCPRCWWKPTSRSACSAPGRCGARLPAPWSTRRLSYRPSRCHRASPATAMNCWPAAAAVVNLKACAPTAAATRCARWCGRRWPAPASMVSRDSSASAAQALLLDYSATGALDTEARLSRLAAWVLAAEHSGQGFGLRLPGQDLPQASGDSQRRSALEALALWQPGAGRA